MRNGWRSIIRRRAINATKVVSDVLRRIESLNLSAFFQIDDKRSPAQHPSASSEILNIRRRNATRPVRHTHTETEPEQASASPGPQSYLR
jgi:hypothetical protein